MKKQTIIIVDDHKIFREGIKLLLSQFEYVGGTFCAPNGKEYLRLIEKVSPDIVLMDINMPKMNGIEATKRSKEINPNIKIVALSMHDNVEYYTEMTESGIDGFITKDTDSSELNTALNKIISGGHYFSQKILQKVISKYNSLEKANVEFSDREVEILHRIAKGMSNKEISEQLFISHRTVERHKENMYKKTDCHNAIKLVVYSVKNKIISI